MQKMKIGVVLSGGGAKGAYEVGFLKALSEYNLQPHAIAGTSIGALNGAIFSAQKDVNKTVEVLESLWEELANDNVLKVDNMKAVKNIVDVFLTFAPMPVSRITKIVTVMLRTGSAQEGVLTQLPISNRLATYAPIDSLKKGLPFYVGMTKSRGNIEDTLAFAGMTNEETVFKKIQSFDDDTMHKAIMASASLPILFDGIEIEGEVYRDGCLSSVENEWGNTPAKPLVTDERCTHLIVCHLNEGSFFNRFDPLFKDISIIEVRPKSGTFSSELDPLMFNVEKINLWINQGYRDAKRILGDAFMAIDTVAVRKKVERVANDSVERLKSREFKLN